MKVGGAPVIGAGHVQYGDVPNGDLDLIHLKMRKGQSWTSTIQGIW
jgi:hypothetical protein